MKKIEVYNPFNTKDYYIEEENGKKYFCIGNLRLELSKDGYIPKSGLLFDKVLDHDICSDKKVLDLGCGYLGILGLIAYINGASSVESIDYDRKCVEWLSKLIKDNNMQNVDCYHSNFFSNVTDRDFDIILSNPPQMPMLTDSLHDSGGTDGRKYVIEILKNSIDYLKENASLYILLFDFLGIDRRTNNNPSIVEISEEIGYRDPKIVLEAEKEIKNGGVTYQNVPYINSIYPNYEFEKGENLKCKLKILRIKK